MSNITSHLEELKKRELIFHGSKFLIMDKLRPNKKKYLDERVDTMKAVYATEIPLIAIFKAVVNIKKIPKVKGARKGLIGWNLKSDTPTFKVTPNYLKFKAFDEGYVYIFDKTVFLPSKKIPRDYYSRLPVMPLAVLKVRPENLLDNSNILLWERSEVEKAGFHTEEQIRAMGYL